MWHDYERGRNDPNERKPFLVKFELRMSDTTTWFSSFRFDTMYWIASSSWGNSPRNWSPVCVVEMGNLANVWNVSLVQASIRDYCLVSHVICSSSFHTQHSVYGYDSLWSVLQLFNSWRAIFTVAYFEMCFGAVCIQTVFDTM